MPSQPQCILRSSRSRRFDPLTLALCLLGLGMERSALAEDTVLPTVTVTTEREQENAHSPTSDYQVRSSRAASKTETPLNESDQSVSVVTRQQIEEQQARSISDALNYTPGVYGNMVGGNTRYNYVVLRGFSGRVVDNEWLDGLKLLSYSFILPQIDPFFVERIDVIRGPASTLYGPTPPGGFIALTSKRPLSEPLRQLELSVGNNQYRSLAFDATGPVAGRSDMDYRWVMKGLSSNLPQTFSQSERYTLAPSLAWRINSQNRLLLQAYLQKDPDIGYHGSVPYSGSAVDHNGWRLPANFDDGAPGDGGTQTLQLYGYQFEHDYNANWQFRQNLRYQKAKTRIRQVYQKGWDTTKPNLLARTASLSEEHSEGYGIDNQLQGQFSTGQIAHTLLVGVDNYRFWNNGSSRTGSPSALDPTSPSYNENINFGAASLTDYRTRQTGVYAQDQLAWRQWRLSLGLRRDEVDTRSKTASSTVRWKGGKTTHRIGLLYQTAQGLSPYFNYSEGFDPSSTAYTDSTGQILPPQESQQKELGVKYQPNGGKLLLSAAVYDLLQKNIAIPVQNTNPLVYEPIGSVRSRGVELEAKARIHQRLSLLASVTANRMRIEQGPDQGKTPFGAPDRMAAVWADYTFANGVGLGSGIRYIGARWVDDGNTLRLPSVTLVDLALRYDLGHLDPSLHGATARLVINNLLNRTYVASCYASANFCYFGTKRNVTATLGYQW